MMKILYAHTAPIDYIRVRKNVEVFDKIGEVTYVGAERDNMRYTTTSSIAARLVNLNYVKPPVRILSGWIGILGLMKYGIVLRRHTAKNNPDVVILTNEELFVLFRLFNPSYSGRIVVDAIDALDLRSNRNKVVTILLKLIVRYVRGSADLIVEVEEFRQNLRPGLAFNSVVIRNTPPVGSIQASHGIRKFGQPYIYASGSLNSLINGIETLVEATNNSNYTVVIAGDISDKNLALFLKDQRHVVLLGRISFEDSVEYARSSYAMFAHYNPNNLNFVYAAPNKVYEAFMLGKPLLINSECLISSFCIENGFGYTSMYGDVVGLKDEIELIKKQDNSLSTGAIQNRFRADYSWEEESKKWVNVIIPVKE